MLSQLWATFAFLPFVLVYTVKLLKTIFISTGKIVKMIFVLSQPMAFLCHLNLIGRAGTCHGEVGCEQV